MIKKDIDKINYFIFNSLKDKEVELAWRRLKHLIEQPDNSDTKDIKYWLKRIKEDIYEPDKIFIHLEHAKKCVKEFNNNGCIKYTSQRYIKLHKCTQCPYFTISVNGISEKTKDIKKHLKQYCQKVGKIIEENIDTIPDWCPLPKIEDKKK